MIRVAISTPTGGRVPIQYTMSLINMVMYFLGKPVLGLENEPDHGVAFQIQVGACIGQARENMVRDFLARPEYTHLLFIDDDMTFSQDCLNIALSRQQPVVLANYRRKLPPAQFTAQRKDKDNNVFELVTKMDSTSLEPCFFGGFGFCLIERQVLEKMESPMFMMYYDKQADLYTTEDKPFFEQVHKLGFDVFVDHEISKRVAHNGFYEYTFDDDQLTQAKARNRE
jgi:hypothetical protein